MNHHDIEICGIERKLPLIKIGKNTKIASFSILGDVELCNALADKIASELKDKDFDYLVGPEVKVVPLIHGVAVRLKHKRYVICRKSIKSYMRKPVKVNPLTHFPKHVRPLVLDGPDVELIKNKKVFVIDDVVSTGVTMRMMKYLMDRVNAKVTGHYTVIKQGEQFDKIDDLKFIAQLPIFKADSSS